MEDNLASDRIIGFLKTVEKFKACDRTCRTTSGRAESDAEHSWHLALLVMLLEKEFEDVDFTQLLRLALIHDLPELYAGDTNPYRGDRRNKEANEKAAAQKLFARLPGAREAEMLTLFNEYQAQTSRESQIVKSADKLLPLIQNLCTSPDHSSYRQLGVTYEEVKAYMDPFFRQDGVLRDFYVRLLEEARSVGVFHQPEHKL